MELIGLGIYVLGWIPATRLAYWGMLRSDGEHPGILLPAFLGAFWPIALGAALIASPFVAVGWLASLGIRRGA